MLTVLKDMPAGVSGLRASGEITRDDYDAVILPMLEEARRDGHRLRLLAHYSPAFDGVSAGGAWEGLRIGVHHLRRIERCAVVSDAEGVRLATWVKAVAGSLFSCAIKVFHEAEWQAALSFLTAPAERMPMPHRLLTDKGVLVLEPQGPLREQDFEAVAAAVDPWIEAHGALRGVVVRAVNFPGWQDVGGLMSHLRFVRDHRPPSSCRPSWVRRFRCEKVRPARIRRIRLGCDMSPPVVQPNMDGTKMEAHVRDGGWRSSPGDVRRAVR